MNERIFISPSKYVQGRHIIENTGEYVKKLGSKAMVLADEFVWDLVGNQITHSLEDAGVSVVKVTFEGEASETEITRITQKAKDEDARVIVGVGGGKTIDTAKAVRNSLDDSACVVIPTTASTDAPTSALSVIYREDGTFERYITYNKNPDLVLVDSMVIAAAPPKFLAFGMADALATWVEARAANEGRSMTLAGGSPTIAAKTIAEKCEETLFDYGLLAYESNKRQVVSFALEQIVEANTLLSGLGFESGGVALAHAVHNGFTALTGDIHHLSHGEKVSFGILTQLTLESRDQKEINRYIDFLSKLNLPVSFKDLHIEEIGRDQLLLVAKTALQQGESSHNMPGTITADEVVDAMITADQYSLAYLKGQHG